MFRFLDGVLVKFAERELQLHVRLEALEKGFLTGRKIRRTEDKVILQRFRSRRLRQSQRDNLAKQRISTADTIEVADAESLHERRLRATQRNKTLLKELEVSAAKLRSRTCYCPTDSQLAALLKRYCDHVSR